MIQPFTKKQIQRYLLAYAGVVVFMGLFYMIVTTYYNPESHPTKLFATQPTVKTKTEKTAPLSVPESKPTTIRLLPKNP